MDLDKAPQKNAATTPSEENVQHIGDELCQIDDYKVVFTKTSDNLKRRAIVLVKENNSWGFTLQTYGIHHKATKEVEMLTYVDYVAFDGPAHKAGMRSGDVILSINGESMENVDHPALVDRIMKCGEKMRMVVFFEDCVRKVEMHQRIIKLQKLLEEKEKEYRVLEEQERKIIEGCSANSSSSEYETDEDDLHDSNISIEITPPQPNLAESPARRASMLGNQFVQMFAPDMCATTDVGAVSPSAERFRASPSFGRRVLRRQAPLEKDYKTSQDYQKISPRLVRKERHFEPISSSEDESGDTTPRESDVSDDKTELNEILKYDVNIVPKGEVKVIAKVNVKVASKQETEQPVSDKDRSVDEPKQVVSESVSHVDSIDDSGLHVVVNKKAAAVLGLCDMTPESQKVRKRSNSGSHGPSPIPDQSEGNSRTATPKPAAENKAIDCEADLTVSKKAARFLGLCEPELESKKPQRSRSANEKDMVRPSSEVFSARSKDNKDTARPQSQFYVAKPGDDDDAVFQEIENRETQRRRSSQFYISLEDIEGDAQSSSSSDAKSVDSHKVHSIVSKFEEKSGTNVDERVVDTAGRSDGGPKVKSGAKGRPGVLVYHYNKRPGHVLQISKSSSLGDLYPMEEHPESHVRHREPKFLRSQSEAVEIPNTYGSLGRKRHRKKRPKGGALVHSQSIGGEVPHAVRDQSMPHSSSTPAVQQSGVTGSKLRSQNSASGIAGEKRIELGEVVIGQGLKSTLGTPVQKSPRSRSPRSATPNPPGTQLTRTAPWGEGELEKVVGQRSRHDSAGTVLEDKKLRKRATSEAVMMADKEHNTRTKSESDANKRSHKKQGMYVVSTREGFSKADLDIPVFEDAESQDVKLIRYGHVSEDAQNSDKSVAKSEKEKKGKRHKSRSKDRLARSALDTEKLNDERRARSPAFLVAQTNIDDVDVQIGCEQVENVPSQSPDIPEVHSSATRSPDSSKSREVKPDNPTIAQKDSEHTQGPEVETSVVNSSSFDQSVVPQVPIVIEEGEARKFSIDGTCIRLGELINEDDEITWL